LEPFDFDDFDFAGGDDGDAAAAAAAAGGGGGGGGDDAAAWSAAAASRPDRTMLRRASHTDSCSVAPNQLSTMEPTNPAIVAISTTAH